MDFGLLGNNGQLVLSVVDMGQNSEIVLAMVLFIMETCVKEKVTKQTAVIHFPAQVLFQDILYCSDYNGKLTYS